MSRLSFCSCTASIATLFAFTPALGQTTAGLNGTIKDLSGAGFKQTTQVGIQLEVNEIARIDLGLQLGAVNEAVEVRAAAPLLEANTSSVGQVVESKVVSDLPLNGRNFAQLAFP
jgi:hypothetical protein